MMTDDKLPYLDVSVGASFLKPSGKANSAVVEVVPLGERNPLESSMRFVIGLNDSHRLSVNPGAYTVRLFLPNGNVMAESVQIEREDEKVEFTLSGSPREKLPSESFLGVVQRLPSEGRADTYKTLREQIQKSIEVQSASLLSESAGAIPETTTTTTPTPTPITTPAPIATPTPTPEALRESVQQLRQVESDVRATAQSIARLTDGDAFLRVRGCRWTSHRHPSTLSDSAPLPGLNQQLYSARDFDMALEWLGQPDPGTSPLGMVLLDSGGARLYSANPLQPTVMQPNFQRCFATVVDPTGDAHILVLPEGWRSLSHDGHDIATVSVVVSASFDKVMMEESDPSERARWKCSVVVDDVDASAYLGFLYNGQIQAASLILKEAESFLYEKDANPIAAAAGAYGLLAYTSEDEEASNSPWRYWIQNLYGRSPGLPDSAIAMAQMYWRFGLPGSDGAEDIDVEVLRDYATEAVHRGIPYFSMGVTLLSDILLALSQDDESNERTGPRVDLTKQHLNSVRKLNRLVVQGEFFTILRFETKSHG
ncbi:hypothetical protein [Luteimonas sp. MC1825]|uniref:hypothetical protein n=1 Tax=Luteimonas sp. MC1825 TaxID=2761107 RepID=UPI0016176AC7|nr:hypothetical protein [Luteimonas sp. MC1825]MBB6600331.1 hypothetical protein [Luteimonas sp. MC1825]QOC88009.1 hypothetical protein IDM46_12440 [Luteimonas sp. MC1825]